MTSLILFYFINYSIFNIINLYLLNIKLIILQLELEKKKIS